MTGTEINRAERVTAENLDQIIERINSILGQKSITYTRRNVITGRVSKTSDHDPNYGDSSYCRKARWYEGFIIETDDITFPVHLCSEPAVRFNSVNQSVEIALNTDSGMIHEWTFVVTP